MLIIIFGRTFYWICSCWLTYYKSSIIYLKNKTGRHVILSIKSSHILDKSQIMNKVYQKLILGNIIVQVIEWREREKEHLYWMASFIDYEYNKVNEILQK